MTYIDQYMYFDLLDEISERSEWIWYGKKNDHSLIKSNKNTKQELQ